MGRAARANAGSWGDRLVYLGTPKGFTEDGPFADSTRRLIAHEMNKPERQRMLWQCHTATGLYVAENRMTLCERFLSSPANWLAMIDSDVEFPRTILESLLATATRIGAKVLAASVPLGDTYPTCGFQWIVNEPGHYRSVPIAREPTRVDAIATACCLIHREALHAIADLEGQKWFVQDIVFPQSAKDTTPRDFRYTVVGEDIAFSIRAGAAGVPLWCYHEPGLGHWKRKRYSHDEEATRALAVANTEGTGELIEEGAS